MLQNSYFRFRQAFTGREVLEWQEIFEMLGLCWEIFCVGDLSGLRIFEGHDTSKSSTDSVLILV